MKLYVDGPPEYCLSEGKRDVHAMLESWRELALAEGGAVLAVSDTVLHVLDLEHAVVAVLTLLDS